MSFIYSNVSGPSETAALDAGRERRLGWLPVFLIWLALSIPSLSAAMIIIRMLMENLPPLSPLFPTLLWSLGLVWLLYLVPTVASVLLTLFRSPRAVFFWRFSAGLSLAVTALAGLGLAAAEPMILGEIWAWLAWGAPELVAWLNQNRLWALPPLAAHTLMALLLALNTVWLARLGRPGRLAEALGCPVQENRPAPPPEVSLFKDDFVAAQSKAGPGLMTVALTVYLTLVVFVALSGLLSMVSRFFFLSPYLEQQSFLGFVFNDIGFYLALALVPLLAAVFGLASLVRSRSGRRGGLPVAMLAICLMSVYSLASAYLNLAGVFAQLPPLLKVLNIVWPLFYLAASIFFLVHVIRAGRRAARM